ncbi:MAG TPA: 2-oxoglutarate dehydrogenase, E2 component, dihydrolipoamide succinyltransferase [Rhodothermales bacterium]|nr:2-oxoglutarate dehydrogenase, E2 component, dihydrolipoamide succinyltransferase [Rhodothermales bacterium]
MAKVEVVMPKMGESVMEGTVLTWHKQPGDPVEEDEALLEIGTDKVDSEIPSPASGTLAEIVVPEGQTVEVGTVLAVIQTETGAETESPKPAPSDAEPEQKASRREEEPLPEKPEVADRLPQGSATPVSSTVVEVTMPKMGESVMEGTVLVWHKKPGDKIEADEALLEIGTDKVDSEIPSPTSGIVQEISVAEGETVAVGTRLATIAAEGPPASDGAAASSPTPEAADKKSEPPAASAPPPASHGGDGMLEAPIPRRGGDGRFYSPLVRSIARTEGVSSGELAEIAGSGREGRVTKDDILSYVDGRRTSGTRPAGEPARQAQAASPTQVGTQPDSSSTASRVEVIEMDRIRQVIAQHMTRSLATSAHVTSFTEADVTNLVRLRDAQKEAFEAREGVRLTYTPFFVKAAVDALKEHPLLNASVEETKIIVKRDFHIGIAVAIEKTGLVVPVIRNAGGMNISGLAHAASDLANRARSKQLQPDELQGGTFTVTNVGSLGSLMGTPIISQPQVAILATGAIKKRPVVKEHPDLGDVIAIAHMVYLSLSYDHRIIDGAMAASYLQHLVGNLEGIGLEDPI